MQIKNPKQNKNRKEKGIPTKGENPILKKANVMYPPKITNSPWTILIIFITPQTKAIPYATNAKIAPTINPSNNA